MKGEVLAISGIDTGIGKTVATGQLARSFAGAGVRTITQKIVQTGCEGVSEDIAAHRELMGIPLQEVDLDGTTCPYLFRFPASPHLAAALEGREIDFMAIRRSTFKLQLRYELVLLEGVGGLLVPLTPELLFADYARDAGYGLVLVTSPRLGSINHTLLSLEACAARRIPVRGIIYNRFFEADERIAADTRTVIAAALKRLGCGDAPVIDLDARGLAATAGDLQRILNPQNN
ncbi:dethiobiotin synthase [Chlorobaculum sp. 24CR]|uniref:dethiobiotin synthase n=1 Tax=Chlorobaculum sp. 24CR TaxID=2508878 RepID=UPI00142FBD28|nr:dethiobiotin synthase [Chlorobaculum sp. 24CR]